MNYIDLPILKRGEGVVAWAKVSLCDHSRLSKFKWYLDSHGYARRTVRENGVQIQIRLHQEVMRTRELIDHKNRDKLDNRRCNLRVVSKSLNAHNTERKGVYFNKRQRRYYAHCRVNGVRHSLGGYGNYDDAAQAVVDFRKEMGLV